MGLKVFLKGFIKGIGVFFVWVALQTFLAVIFTLFTGADLSNDVYKSNLVSKILLLSYIPSLIFASYLIFKFKLMKAWMLLVLIIGPYSIPFIFGAIELNRKLPKKRK